MTLQEFYSFVGYLSKDNKVYGPVKIEDQLYVSQIFDPKKIVLDGQIPKNSFKSFFLPAKETIFHYDKNDLVEENKFPKQIICGMNVLDLKALVLYHEVFKDDWYFQQRMENSLIIGQVFIPGKEERIFEAKYEENVLEHLRFDIFLKNKGDYFQVFCGSSKGDKVLSDFGYKNYSCIKFVGPVREEGPNQRMLKIKEVMMKKYNQKVWQDLGKRCIECGKCTLVCPTCFCYRIDDQAKIEQGKGARERCWDSCFYEEFSEVAGGHKFLNTVEERIYFWYYHKFVRIPKEYNLPGCVDCGRCIEVCPVYINIREEIEKILTDEK